MRYGQPVEVADGVHVALARMATVAPDETQWRARERTATRVLLRRLLTEVCGPDTADTPLAARRTGQPYLPERPDVTVSLSHSGEWAAAAIGVGPSVGVDVQVPQPAARLVRRCCRPPDREMLAGMPAPRRDLEFAWLWTAQEACVKATGAGLAGLPWTIPVEIGQRAGRWQGVRWLSLRDRCHIPVSCAWEAA
jgi:4'-phosphopantetheinyl transferase